MTDTEKEQAAQAAIEAAKAAKEAAKAAKAEERKQASEAKKLEREQLKTQKAAEKEAAKAAKEQAKAAALAEKEASKQPEQNGVRRPKPETLCGKAWAIFDQVSAVRNAPASIGESIKIAEGQGLNVGNVKAEYARWRKFHGVEGRVADPTAPVAETKKSEPAAE